MLLEQMIEFEFRGPKSHGRICTPTTGYFHVQNLQGNSSTGSLFTAKILQEALFLTFPLSGRNHLQNLTPNARFYTWFQLKLIEQFNFFNGFLTLKIWFFQMALNTCKM